MLNVLIVPPPVPQVSTKSSGRSAGSTTIACRSARTTAASSLRRLALHAQADEERRDLHRRRVAAKHDVERVGQLAGIGRIASGEAFDRSEQRVGGGLADTEGFVEAFGQGARATRRARSTKPRRRTRSTSSSTKMPCCARFARFTTPTSSIVVDERKADERSRREVLIAKQRMRLRIDDVANEHRLATSSPRVPATPCPIDDARALA